MYCVNPPLVRSVAALPVLMAGFQEDWSGFHDGVGVRPEFVMGEDFIAANASRSDFLLMLARLACVPFSWCGAVACYMWARDLYGVPAGITACAIWCFEPNIIAHASLITPDAHATAIGVGACYIYWRWLKQPTLLMAVLSGVALGLALLAKATFLLLYPQWMLLLLIYRIPGNVKGSRWQRELGMLLLQFLLSLLIVNCGYGFDRTFTSLEDIPFVSDTLSQEGEFSRDGSGRVNGGQPIKGINATNDSDNRFKGAWIGRVPSPLPMPYLLGLDYLEFDFSNLVRPSYLRGAWQDQGWWYYYIYAIAVKVPLGLLLLLLAQLCATAMLLLNHNVRSLASIRDLIALLLPPAVFLIAVSAKVGICEHMRYVLPCFPFIFIWIAGLRKNLIDIRPLLKICFKSIAVDRVVRLACYVAGVMLLWAFASSLWVYPHCLSYFNESIGGPLNGSRHLLGSSFDWGQDGKYLRSCLSCACSESSRCAASFSDRVEMRSGALGSRVAYESQPSVRVVFISELLSAPSRSNSDDPVTANLDRALVMRPTRCGYTILLYTEGTHDGE